MKISEMILGLQTIKEEYGDLVVLGSDDYEIDYVDIQKLIKTRSSHNKNITNNQTEDLDETYLEEVYIENEEYSHLFVEQGMCVKVY